MSQKQLKNKPLIEAILELRWQLIPRGNGHETDPHYKLLLGRLYDRLLTDYPEHEQLAAASLPDELFGHVVQHRFRASTNGWPLIQLGPGILTVNATADYTWNDFRSRAAKAFRLLYDAHPKASELKIVNITLRYIDAVEFDYSTANVYDFLKDKLKVNINLPANLFEKTGVQNRPDNFVWNSTFSCSDPKGVVMIRFASGQKEWKPAILWETTIQASDDEMPEMPAGFDAWFDAAHNLTGDWFFKLIEGELERRFSGE